MHVSLKQLFDLFGCSLVFIKTEISVHKQGGGCLSVYIICGSVVFLLNGNRDKSQQNPIDYANSSKNEAGDIVVSFSHLEFSETVDCQRCGQRKPHKKQKSSRYATRGRSAAISVKISILLPDSLRLKKVQFHESQNALNAEAFSAVAT